MVLQRSLFHGVVPHPENLKVALILHLNIDIDPPDIIRSANLECWVDPHTLPTHKAPEAIDTNLPHQFEGLSPQDRLQTHLWKVFIDFVKVYESKRKTTQFHSATMVPKPTIAVFRQEFNAKRLCVATSGSSLARVFWS